MPRPEGLSPTETVTAGESQCAMLSAAFLYRWADETQAFAAVSAGWGFACGLKTDGAAECWGNTDRGQADVPAGTFTAVSTGEGHVCGLRVGGDVDC